MPLFISPSLQIPDNDLEEKFMRAAGAGGQNVNKVSTAVQLRFHARKCKALPNHVFLNLQKVASHLMTQKGDLVLTAQHYRTQEQNRQDARERLAALILDAAHTPKHRRATKPTKTSQLKRLHHKAKHADVKKSRGRLSQQDD